MRVCAVICEYNPFHNGHARHLALAREKSGADFMLCLMSGALTQRGAFARHDKWLRARMALLGGADLVLELPCRFACAPAPDFASGGVALLRALNVVTHLSFGCEAQSLDILFAARDALRDESPAFQSVLKDALDRGLPYPRARALAAESASGLSGLAEQIALPNAALALEYLQALPDGISAVPILREGCGYHDSSPSPLASATGVRAALTMGDVQTASAAVPFPQELLSAERRGEFHPEDALTQALFYRLRTMDAASLRDIVGMD